MKSAPSWNDEFGLFGCRPHGHGCPKASTERPDSTTLLLPTLTPAPRPIHPPPRRSSPTISRCLPDGRRDVKTDRISRPQVVCLCRRRNAVGPPVPHPQPFREGLQPEIPGPACGVRMYRAPLSARRRSHSRSQGLRLPLLPRRAGPECRCLHDSPGILQERRHHPACRRSRSIRRGRPHILPPPSTPMLHAQTRFGDDRGLGAPPFSPGAPGSPATKS